MLGKIRWDLEQAQSLIDARRGEPGAMLPILHGLQERFGYIIADRDPISPIARNLINMQLPDDIVSLIAPPHKIGAAP